MIVATIAVAVACGQTTHIWTALHAVEHLPPGALRTMLEAPEAQRALISGTMFPDGGYSPLVNHRYGEVAHWEPFQDRVLTWVADNHRGDAEHEAFLYGLAAHGIGDQLFDAMYLYRGDEGQPDEETDIVIASLWGGHDDNEHFVPYTGLVSLFADAGVDVDEATMRQGMASLDVAVFYVGRSGENQDAVAEARAAAPWATSHLEDESVPGAPVCLGKTIAAYWQVIERRLGGDEPASLVMASFPADGSYDHPTDGRDATISVVFARAMEQATVQAPGVMQLSGPDGDVDLDVWLYYRQGSHVLNALPQSPLHDDSTYTITVQPGPTGIGGETMDEVWTAAFSTGPAPVIEDIDDPQGCGCRSVPSSAMGWVVVVALGLVRRRHARA